MLQYFEIGVNWLYLRMNNLATSCGYQSEDEKSERKYCETFNTVDISAPPGRPCSYHHFSRNNRRIRWTSIHLYIP